ncbi:hypothetical protein ACFQ0K_00280 [Nocardioides caeni]|uniref:Mce-associated membrane protein n=1 Tax=Nocardioides caeni TaxID=574700 RepID=A0A4V4HLK6_9ACTN|nr:hypothetical protein [Nocardioides caeni]THV18676.1 hypothetical protein E9934_03465 [Nocardioides caeni]
MSRPTPRRPASSRGTTPRPRRLAGQATVRPDAPVDESVDESVDDITDENSDDTVVSEAATTKAAPSVSLRKSSPPSSPPSSSSTVSPQGPSVRRVGAGERPDRPGVLARAKTTRMLIATLVVVALALALQCAILIVDLARDEPQVDASEASSVETTDERPVIADDKAVREGVDAAAKAALEIVAVDHRKFDDEVDAAADLMTDQFEEQYRETTAGIQEQFVANQTQVQATVVAQGVVRANLTRLQALVFLNQVVSRVREGEPETVYTPFKVLVTMVHTDQGWLVDGLDTDAPRDKSN